jgi:biotin transport system substrate-specific component
MLLFALLIGCGTKTSLHLPVSPVPASQQLFFVMLAGALLGSRPGTIAALLYLLMAAVTGWFWPVGAGMTPLLGPLAGYLWSLPLVAYCCGVVVERARSETPIFYAMGISAGIALFNAMGCVRLIAALELRGTEGFWKGAGLFVGQQMAQGALAVFIASSASSTLQAREKR